MWNDVKTDIGPHPCALDADGNPAVRWTGKTALTATVCATLKPYALWLCVGCWAQSTLYYVMICCKHDASETNPMNLRLMGAERPFLKACFQ